MTHKKNEDYIRLNPKISKVLTNPLLSTVLEQQQRYIDLNSFSQQMSEVMNSIRPIDVSPMFQAINAVESTLHSNLPNILAINKSTSTQIARIQEQIQQISQSTTIYTEVTDSIKAAVESLNSTFYQIKNIDLSGLEKLNLDSLINEEEIKQSHEDLSATITVEKPKKKLKDMTESEFEDLLKRNISKFGKFSLGAFIYSLFDEYVKEIALVVLEITFAVLITIVSGQFNAEVIEEIGNRIEETDTHRDAKKIITRYVKVNPTEEIAFLRKEVYLRKGASKSAPIVSQGKISTKTILTIVNDYENTQRKGNWVKVMIDTGNSCGEVGWVQESLLIKFKKVNEE